MSFISAKSKHLFRQDTETGRVAAHLDVGDLGANGGQPVAGRWGVLVPLVPGPQQFTVLTERTGMSVVNSWDGYFYNHLVATKNVVPTYIPGW